MTYSRNVFINCPFDDGYKEMLEALVFAVHDSGFVARSALEASDSSVPRIQKIQRIIAECRYGVHDVSRTELDADSGLPRFNMPLELGIFLGAKHFGESKQKQKNCLVLDRERYRYQQFMSDIAGQDISPHEGKPDRAIKIVRNWLRKATPKNTMLPGAKKMVERFDSFHDVLPAICEAAHQDYEDLIFNDYTTLLVAWIRENPWGS